MEIINLGVLAHVDAGKTTLTESILFHTGIVNKIGKVDKGTTTTDSISIERDRGISIKASAISFNYKNCKINLIDTPGHSEFISEVERSLSVLDGAILVISAKEGIQLQTKLLYKTLKKLNIPFMIFINKVDRLGSDIDIILKDLYKSFNDKYDVLQRLTKEGTRDSLIEYKPLYENPDDRFNNISLLKTKNIIPIYMGSALHDIGITDILEGMPHYFNHKYNSLADSSFYVFKIDRLNNVKRTYIKVLSGTLKIRNKYKCQEVIFKVNNLNFLKNGKAVPTESVLAGDIGIIYNDKSLKIGDVIGDKIAFKNEVFIPKSPLSVRVSNINGREKEKLIKCLNELTEQDPYLNLIILKNGEIQISVMGEIHIEIIKELIEVDYGLKVLFSEPLFILKEKPIYEASSTIYMGTSIFPGTVGFSLEPLPLGSGFVYESNISTGELPKPFHNAVYEGVLSQLNEGILGWQITDLKIIFTKSKYDSVTSTPSDFRHLASLGVIDLINKAKTQLLEPYCKIEIIAPNNILGKIIYVLESLNSSYSYENTNESNTHIISSISSEKNTLFQKKINKYLSDGVLFFNYGFSGYSIKKDKLIKNPYSTYNNFTQKEYMYKLKNK